MKRVQDKVILVTGGAMGMGMMGGMGGRGGLPFR